MTDLKTYASKDLLLPEDAELLDKAIESREQAYAPYSHFRVGAAVRLANGEIIVGNNQENAAYPSGLCAERIAVFAAKSNYPHENITAIAITARNENKQSTPVATSCGACRQVMVEYELDQRAPIRVIFSGDSGEVWSVDEVKTLLPYYFNKDAL